MKQANIALIGYGYWGQKIYRYLKESSNFNLSAVYFRSLEKLPPTVIEQEYGPEFTPRLKEDIWLNKNIPHVVIVTPINTHYSLVREALLNSKNVLVEKPLTTKTEEALLLQKMAKEKNLKLMTEYPYTFSKALLMAQKLVKEGAIGSLKSISITIKQLGRFLEYDVNTLLGTHALSILDMFLPIKDCQFSCQPLLVTDNIVTGSIIQFKAKESDCQGYIDVNLHCPERDKKVIIYGTKGTIIYDPYAEKTLQLTLYSCQRNVTQAKDLINQQTGYDFDENNNLQYAVTEFFEVINNQKPDNSDRSVAVTTALESLAKL